MRLAWLNLRYTLPERIRIFAAGLGRHGYGIEQGCPTRLRDGDLFVTWNRIGQGDVAARNFERIGNQVLVAENASWGNEFAGERWYTIARNHHNTAHCFEHGGPERWDAMQIALHPLRHGGETLILPQRGIGSPPTAMPVGWAMQALRRYGGRVRAHPGRFPPCVSLWDDLEHAGTVATWGSGAAILAALWGCTVHSEMPGWIGEHEPGHRLAMFRRLAWAQWTHDEIESGEAFDRLLKKETA